MGTIFYSIEKLTSLNKGYIMTDLLEYNLDTIKIAIAEQKELLRNTSEKSELTLYDERLDKLNRLMILKDSLR